MSIPGTQDANTRPSRAALSRSVISAGPAPGYWTFTATSRPSRHVARCTWPIDAAAAGASSKWANRDRQPGPSSSRRTAWTRSAGNGGAASCSLVSVAR